jgi:hypothetical protein
MKATLWCGFGMLAAALAGCSSPQADNLRDTYLDADYKSVPMIDLAVPKPAVASPVEPVMSAVFRDAARTYLLDVKAYSVLSDERVDAVAGAAGITAASDGPSAARAFPEADGVVLIDVTEWDRSWLVPRGSIYASGRVAVYAKRDGRRVYETTFTRERLASPGRLSEMNASEAERQMAVELIRLSLAGLPKKITK